MEAVKHTDPNTSPIRAIVERLGISWRTAKAMPAKTLMALVAAYNKGFEDGLAQSAREVNAKVAGDGR